MGLSGPTPSPSLFCAAVIAAPHGLHGHVKVKCFLEDPRKFEAYSPYSNERGEATYTVKKVVSQDKDVLIVSLNEISDRNQAELIKGAKLMLSRDRLPHLSEDTYYHRDLMGLSVESSFGDFLGTVHALYNFGAGDLLEIKTIEDRLEMIPFTRTNVSQVNIEEGFLLLSQEGEIFLKGDNDVS
ncbi:MAG: ribosome maturation factor RimM [Alphaproteobacteria bacterium]|nr:ribosome maturation factor RimM [Alphaproteobacteria bacterium]